MFNKVLPLKRFSSFVIFGLINTGTTYLIYLIFREFTHYQIAYFISYIFGILFAYLVNLFIVFKEKSTLRKIFQYPLIYIINYITGSCLLFFFIAFMNISEQISPLIVAILLVPISYIMNKIVLTK